MREGHEHGRPMMGPNVESATGEDEDVESDVGAHRHELQSGDKGSIHRKGEGCKKGEGWRKGDCGRCTGQRNGDGDGDNASPLFVGMSYPRDNPDFGVIPIPLNPGYLRHVLPNQT